MDWPNERYVRIYTRDTADWVCLSWEARGLFLLMLRKADRSGVVAAKRGERAVASLVDMPLDVFTRAIAELIEDGCVLRCEGGFVIPNYLEAQEASQSNAQRQRESRAKRRARATTDNGSSHNRTPSDKASQPVTRSHTVSQAVTPSHSSLTSLAIPSQPSQTTSPEGGGSLSATATLTNNWPARTAEFWTSKAGVVKTAFVGRLLEPLVKAHGEDLVREAMGDWIQVRTHQGKPLKLQFFAEEAVPYIEQAKQPIVDDAGVLTARGRAMMNGRLGP